MQGPSSGLKVMPVSGNQGNGGLLDFLHSLQEQCGGSIPFERYMAEALHHPRFGYYGSRIANVGARGDFSTSATISESLGTAIAAWCLARAKALKWQRIAIIEVGAGNGMLARTVLRQLGWFRRLRTDYLIVESSPVLKERQIKLLRRQGVKWHDSVESALGALDGQALIFSNELVDAFPCRLFEKQSDGWSELNVTLSHDGSLAETIGMQIQGDPWFNTFRELPLGQRIERHESFLRWLGGWAPQLRQGSVLTIDYGDVAGKLYEGKIAGSIRAYWKHQRLTRRDIYARFGKQDLTADVNFSDLMEWGKSFGWHTSSYTTQADFLKEWTSSNKTNKDLFLSCEEGAGTAFKVLEQTPVKTEIEIS